MIKIFSTQCILIPNEVIIEMRDIFEYILNIFVIAVIHFVVIYIFFYHLYYDFI